MKKYEHDDHFKFKAPTEELEAAIVDFALTMGIPFWEFWYNWFPSSRNNENRNHTIHLECNIKSMAETIKMRFAVEEIVEKIFRVTEIPLPEYCEYRYQYYIHFKMKENVI